MEAPEVLVVVKLRLCRTREFAAKDPELAAALGHQHRLPYNKNKIPGYKMRNVHNYRSCCDKKNRDLSQSFKSQVTEMVWLLQQIFPAKISLRTSLKITYSVVHDHPGHFRSPIALTLQCYTLMRIRIRPTSLMRTRIQPFTLIRFRILISYLYTDPRRLNFETLGPASIVSVHDPPRLHKASLASQFYLWCGSGFP